jgi:hypothetical protein
MRRLLGRMPDEDLAYTCLRRGYPDVGIGRSVVADRRSGIVCLCHYFLDFGLQPLIGGEALTAAASARDPPSKATLVRSTFDYRRD